MSIENCDACGRRMEGFHPVVLESVHREGYRLCAGCGGVVVAVVHEIQRSRLGARPYGLTKARRLEEKSLESLGKGKRDPGV